jgi:hypothetical protein
MNLRPSLFFLRTPGLRIEPLHRATFSDRCNFTHNSNESIAVGGISRIDSDDTLHTVASCNLYSYAYALDSTSAGESIDLAYTGGATPGEGAFIAAVTLSGGSGETTAPASYTLSAGSPSG